MIRLTMTREDLITHMRAYRKKVADERSETAEAYELMQAQVEVLRERLAGRAAKEARATAIGLPTQYDLRYDHKAVATLQIRLTDTEQKFLRGLHKAEDKVEKTYKIEGSWVSHEVYLEAIDSAINRLEMATDKTIKVSDRDWWFAALR